jgi:hypothetical protein
MSIPRLVERLRPIRGNFVAFAVPAARLQSFLSLQKRSSSRRFIAQNPHLGLAGRDRATALLRFGLHSGHAAK